MLMNILFLVVVSEIDKFIHYDDPFIAIRSSLLCREFEMYYFSTFSLKTFQLWTLIKLLYTVNKLHWN